METLGVSEGLRTVETAFLDSMAVIWFHRLTNFTKRTKTERKMQLTQFGRLKSEKKILEEFVSKSKAGAGKGKINQKLLYDYCNTFPVFLELCSSD